MRPSAVIAIVVVTIMRARLYNGRGAVLAHDKYDMYIDIAAPKATRTTEGINDPFSSTTSHGAQTPNTRTVANSTAATSAAVSNRITDARNFRPMSL